MKHHAARRASAGFGLALTCLMIATGVLGAVVWPAASARAAEATTNADVNLRSGPGETYEVLSVVPVGGVISVDGDAVDGFAPVTYNGISGWLSVGFVVAAGTAPVAAYDTQTTGATDGATDGVTDGVTDGDLTTTVNGDEIVYNSDSGESGESRSRRNRNGDTPATVTTPPSESTAPEGAIANPGAPVGSEGDIVAVIQEAATAYGQNPDDMLRVARCESNLNPRAVDPSGSYHGLFQFVPSTFAGTPYGGQDIYDPWANAHAAAWMWSEGRKAEWVCQ